MDNSTDQKNEVYIDAKVAEISKQLDGSLQQYIGQYNTKETCARMAKEINRTVHEHFPPYFDIQVTPEPIEKNKVNVSCVTPAIDWPIQVVFNDDFGDSVVMSTKDFTDVYTELLKCSHNMRLFDKLSTVAKILESC